MLAPDAPGRPGDDRDPAFAQLRHPTTSSCSTFRPTYGPPGRLRTAIESGAPTHPDRELVASWRGADRGRRGRRGRAGRGGGGDRAGPGRARRRRRRQGGVPARQVLRRRADDAGAARARGARLRARRGRRLAGRRRRRAALTERPPGPRPAARRARARTPRWRRGCSSTTRSSTLAVKAGATVLQGHGFDGAIDERGDHVVLGVDGHAPDRGPLRRRRRRHVEPGAQGARPRRARLPRRVARLPPVRPRRRRRRPPTTCSCGSTRTSCPATRWSFPLPGGRANVGFGVLRDGSRRIQDMKAHVGRPARPPARPCRARPARRR